MKHVLLTVVLLLSFFMLSTCSRAAQVPDSGVDEITALSLADERSGTIMELWIRGFAHGDFSEMNAYLDKIDPGGDLAGIMNSFGENVSSGDGPLPSLGAGLPPFSDPVYRDGDILLSHGGLSPIGALMQTILPGSDYTHAGVLDKDLGLVISANLAGLTYETWQEWNYGSAGITVMRIEGIDTGSQYDPIDFVQAYMGGLINDPGIFTYYSFIKIYPPLPPIDPNNPQIPPWDYFVTEDFELEPVEKEDDLLWYCSKAAWRVYDALEIDIEERDYYPEPSGSGLIRQDSLLYQLYFYVLQQLRPGKEEWIINKTEAKVDAFLKTLVTPDEIGHKSGLIHVGTWPVLP